MTKEQILEGNKLIATFMGYKYHPHPEKDCGWRKENGHMKINGRGYYLCRKHSELRYYNSWDWLMECIEKIDYIQFGDYKKIDYSLDCYGWISWHKNIPGDQNQKQFYSDNDDISPLQNNWIAVVKFIEFYNDQKAKGTEREKNSLT